MFQFAGVLVALGHAVRAEMLEHSDLVLDVPARAASVVPTWAPTPALRKRAGTVARLMFGGFLASR